MDKDDIDFAWSTIANLWLRVSASAEMFEQAGEARARAHTFHVDSGSELDT